MNCPETISHFIFNSQALDKRFNGEYASVIHDPTKSDICYLAGLIREQTCLRMFGFDVLKHQQNGRSIQEYLTVIDVNFFPGYAGMNSMSSNILTLCQHLFHQKQHPQDGFPKKISSEK